LAKEALMRKARRVREKQHIFSEKFLNFRAEEKALREMGANEDDFYEPLINLLEEFIISLTKAERFAARNAKIYLDYRFFALSEINTFRIIGSYFYLTPKRIGQVIHKVDRLLRLEKTRAHFKKELYERVLANVQNRTPR